MNTRKITSKGQVTLRMDILQHLGASPGDKLVLSKTLDGGIEVHAARGKGKISDAFGMLKREGGPTLSIEEMNEIIAEGWAGR